MANRLCESAIAVAAPYDLSELGKLLASVALHNRSAYPSITRIDLFARDRRGPWLEFAQAEDEIPCPSWTAGMLCFAPYGSLDYHLFMAILATLNPKDAAPAKFNSDDPCRRKPMPSHCFHLPLDESPLASAAMRAGKIVELRRRREKSFEILREFLMQNGEKRTLSLLETKMAAS